jgi:uncharacterized membrane protein
MSKPIAPSEHAPAALPVSRAADRRLTGVVVLAALVAYPIVAAFAIEHGLAVVVHAAPIAVNLALAAWFATTLRAGHEPMITRFARAERGALEADLAVYTRALTWVWVALFVALAAIDAVLAVAGTRAAWLAFTGAGGYLMVAALFLGEWVYRRWRFRHYRHASPLALVRHVVAVMRPRP